MINSPTSVRAFHEQGYCIIRNLINRADLADPQAWFGDDEIDTTDSACAELDPGDALVFHSLILHGSDRNETETPRRSFIFRYMDVVDLPDKHWPLVRKHGVVLNDDHPHPIFQDRGV